MPGTGQRGGVLKGSKHVFTTLGVLMEGMETPSRNQGGDTRTVILLTLFDEQLNNKNPNGELQSSGLCRLPLSLFGGAVSVVHSLISGVQDHQDMRFAFLMPGSRWKQQKGPDQIWYSLDKARSLVQRFGNFCYFVV